MCYVLDKTGTITENTMEVQELVPVVISKMMVQLNQCRKINWRFLPNNVS